MHFSHSYFSLQSKPSYHYSNFETIAYLWMKFYTQWSFSGISTFAHLEYKKCLTTPEELFDIGILGVPFDTAVSYRPGARFGPKAIRAASARQTSFRGCKFLRS